MGVEGDSKEAGSSSTPCSALKGETVPDSLPATPKSPPTRRVPPRGTPRVPAPLPLASRLERRAESLASPRDEA